MSNLSSDSSGMTSGRARGCYHGIPKACWCGDSVTKFTSKTDANPGRRFYRCSFAATRKLKIDGSHVFKWVDEALEEEKAMVDDKEKKFEEEVKAMQEIITESLDNGKKMIEKMEMDLEERLIERIEVAMLDTKRRLWKSLCLVVVIGCIIIIGCNKLVGV